MDGQSKLRSIDAMWQAQRALLYPLIAISLVLAWSVWAFFRHPPLELHHRTAARGNLLVAVMFMAVWHIDAKPEAAKATVWSDKKHKCCMYDADRPSLSP